MKKSTRRLVLHRETLVQLDPNAMSQAAGGFTETGAVRRLPNTDIEITGITCSDVPIVTVFC